MTTKYANIHKEIANHEFKGRMNNAENAVGWQWSDLFGPKGLEADVWRLEVVPLLAGEMLQMARTSSYKSGLILAVEVIGAQTPPEPYEAPWWFWWSAEEAHALFRDFEKPHWPLLERADQEARSIYEWFSAWPRQDTLIVHILHEAPKSAPVVLR